MTTTAMSLGEMILLHIRASGPVSFRSIEIWCKNQYTGPDGKDAQPYEMAAALTELIKEGRVEIYDTFDSFI